MAQSLAELKAENAKLAESEPTTPQVVEEEIDNTVDEEELDTPDEIADLEGEDSESELEDQSEASEIEEWMKSEEPESQDADKKFTDSDIGRAKSKLRAKLESKHNSELDKLKNEIEQLKKGGNTTQTQTSAKPRRNDFLDRDDPDEAYIEALTDWKTENQAAKQKASSASEQAQQRQQETSRAIENSVDQHYERAIVLAQKSNISAEAYQATDLKVRQTIESVFPNGGDQITDALIANLGEGSERVFFNLGVNATRLNTLREKLTNDPSGLSASAYLGRLSGELNAPDKRKTRAPKPAGNVNGDNRKAAGNTQKRKYDKYHAEGNTQAAFSLKRKAKQSGVDTTSW